MKLWQMILAPPLALLSFIYAGAMKVRAWFFHVGVFPSDSSGAFVVSIGNLQAGGTGKTPAAAFFAERWRQSVRLGIVSRGYGRKSRGSLRVDPKIESAAEKFGDEPTWLASKFESGAEGDVPVQVGESRLQAAQDLIVAEGLKLVLLDDGFQHLHLRRSYDIVLVDVSAPRWHWRVLPWGRLREPVSALRRADAIVLTKTESVSREKLALFEKQVRRWAGRTLVLQFEQRLSWTDEIQNEPLVLAAGLAAPSSFFQLVKAHPSKPNVKETIPFPDHHAYTEEDVARIKATAQRHGARRVLVTEKDAVKLRKLWRAEDRDVDGVELVVSSLEVRPVREFDEKQLEQIDEVVFGQMRGSSGPRGKLPSRDSAT